MKNESDELSKAEKFAQIPINKRKQILAGYPKERLEVLKYSWDWWGRPKQQSPEGDWYVWLILAGRGFGKTRTGAEWVKQKVYTGNFKHIALVGETAADVRDVMLGDGVERSNPMAGSGLLQIFPKHHAPLYIASKRRVEFHNGAIATLYNAVEPSQLRGPQHDLAWLDELCKFRYQQELWDQLQFGMRLGSKPQICITTTPKPTKLLKDILSDPHTTKTVGSTLDNTSNLAGSFLDQILRKYAGTRLGRQELNAELLGDLEGALWKWSVIEDNRRVLSNVPPLKRVVVAIDPAVSSNDDSNETGIIVAGVSEDNHAYILDDFSGVYTPLEWAKIAVSLYHERRADRIVAEINQGGALVEETIRTVDRSVSYKPVWASKGKWIRAEPVSALYEKGLVHHVGMFEKLESQMTSFTVDFDRKAMGYSPDRLDAAVWAISELLVEGDERRPMWGSI